MYAICLLQCIWRAAYYPYDTHTRVVYLAYLQYLFLRDSYVSIVLYDISDAVTLIQITVTIKLLHSKPPWVKQAFFFVASNCCCIPSTRKLCTQYSDGECKWLQTKFDWLR